MSIREPTADRNGMLGMENVGCWRIVDNDGFAEISSDLGKILDVVSLVIIATFTEQTVMYDVMDV